MCYLLLWPSKGSSVENVSSFFGGTDFTDALGHVALMGIETALLYGLFRYYAPRHASRYALGSAMLLGLILEVAQRWIPDRGSTWYDLAANWMGAVMLLVVVSKASRFDLK
jgi:VanZ family protein